MHNTLQTKAVITGCGYYLPDNLITNHELSKTVDTTHEWIVERTGIHERRFASKDQGTSDLAVNAARMALDHAGVKAEEIDLIIVGTATPDETFPSTGTIVQHKLGNTKALAFDVAGVCAGYLLSLNVADSFLRMHKAKKALVIGAEKISSLLDMSDRTTCVLFGDGAGAVVLEAKTPEENPDDRGIIGIDVQSDGQFHDILHASGGPSTTGTVGKLRMEGREVFRHAVTKLAESAEDILKKYQIHPDAIDWLIPHQANLRIIDGMTKKLGLPPEKVVIKVQKHANTSAASIPLALGEAVHSGKIKKGDMIMHEAIGGGLIWGSGILKF